MEGALLEVINLKTHFFTERGVARAVDGISFSLRSTEIVALVGESGCGKSVTALSIMRLLPELQARIVKGRILFHGRDLITLSNEEIRRIRGNRISMVFQEPMTSLNPVFRVGDQIAEVLQVHMGLNGRQALDQAITLLHQVGIPAPEKRVSEYPHQMSGGMRQRVMIAMALACKPELLIADEPTTALDVTIQAQILDLMEDLRDKSGLAILLITHDLAIVAEKADRVVVMYAGRIVEEADVRELFRNPLHPYTQALMRSIPGRERGKRRKRLETIPGTVPSPLEFPPGCRFCDRCPEAFRLCKEAEPSLSGSDEGHPVRCWLYL